MKKSFSFIIIALFSTFLIISCSRSPEKKIAGTWKVEDVKFDSNRPVDQAKLDASKESAKSVSYELLEDKKAKIHVGSTDFEGFWTYKKAEAGVYMSFTGSFDTVLLGKFQDGKLINEATRQGIKITTIFTKAD
jgi:hypothetical protein